MPEGSVLGPLFLIYINDLHLCLKYSKACHFADNTNITLSDSSQETLAERVNYDLRKLSMWLRANKLSLNIEKTELVVFWRQSTKLNNLFKIKLNGKRLFPTSSVKYLGVLLHEHLMCSPQISHVQMKLNRAVGNLTKLRYQANIHILKTLYHFLFETHLTYVCQLWGQNNKETQKKFRTLQNRALKKIAFKRQYKSANPLYENLKTIKFQYLLCLNNCLYMC